MLCHIFQLREQINWNEQIDDVWVSITCYPENEQSINNSSFERL
jgi:hypothetical protein